MATVTIEPLLLQGRPYEEVFHFPLKKRLEALMSTHAYDTAIQYERTRPIPADGVVAGGIIG